MRPRWKLIGLAGAAGVAATGVVAARQRRAHHDLEVDELREHLHLHLAEVRQAAMRPTEDPREPAPAMG